MKKLLILLLVLGLASVSYGAYGDIRDDFELHLSGGTLTVVGLVADPGVDISAGIYDEASQGTFGASPLILSDGASGNAAGALGNAVHASGTGYDGMDITVLDSSPSTDTVNAMDWFSVSYTGDVVDTIQIYDYYESNTVAIGTLDIIPEPVTVVLLGLGGLFLRRRK